MAKVVNIIPAINWAYFDKPGQYRPNPAKVHQFNFVSINDVKLGQ